MGQLQKDADFKNGTTVTAADRESANLPLFFFSANSNWQPSAWANLPRKRGEKRKQDKAAASNVPPPQSQRPAVRGASGVFGLFDRGHDRRRYAGAK